MWCGLALRRCSVLLVMGWAAWLLGAPGARAAEIRIDHIELFSTNLVLVHFDTEANRHYFLQYLDIANCPDGGLGSCLNPGVSGTWSNLFEAPKIPTVSHYIVPDTRTNRWRFYRLKVTP